jgi:hypothetical protein
MSEVIGRLNPATIRSITRQLAVVLGMASGTGRPRRPRANKYALYKTTKPNTSTSAQRF